jgi:hypothetical protein
MDIGAGTLRLNAGSLIGREQDRLHAVLTLQPIWLWLNQQEIKEVCGAKSPTAAETSKGEPLGAL